MTQGRKASAEGRLLGIQFRDKDTLERWHANPRDDRRVGVRTFRRDANGYWKEDRGSRRTETKDAWNAIERKARVRRRELETHHPLNACADSYDSTAHNERSLRDQMLFEVLDEIIDADVTGDDEWLIGLWRIAACRFEARNGWVRSAGESPLRRGPTRGKAQRQLLDTARSALLPLSRNVSTADATKLAARAAGALALRVTEHFPIQADRTDGNLTTRATEIIAAEIRDAWSARGSATFPDEQWLRVLVRRALAACGLPEKLSYTFFHGEHEAGLRERRKKMRASGARSK